MKQVCNDLRRFNTYAGVENRTVPGLPETPSEVAAVVSVSPTASEVLQPSKCVLADELQGIANALALQESTLKTIFPKSEVALAARLIVSEVGETLDAMAKNDIVEVADGIADTIYVLVQAAMRFGIPLEAVWSAVQASNLSKFPQCEACGGEGWVKDRIEPTRGEQCVACVGVGRVSIRDAQGKVQKPPGWTPPDIGRILARETSMRPESQDYATALEQSGWSGNGFDNLGRVVIPPGCEAALSDTINRIAHVRGLALKASLPDAVTFSSIVVAGLPLNIGSGEAAVELVQVIPMNFRVEVGHTIRFWLHNHSDKPVTVSATLLTEEDLLLAKRGS